MPANVQQAAPFFAVLDIERSVRYSIGGLGFEVMQRWVDQGKSRWCCRKSGAMARAARRSRSGEGV